MKRILFVDDDPNVLSGIRRSLHSMRGEWQMEFADSAEGAIAILDKVPVDVLITDVRMRYVDGFQLLKEAKNSYPRAVRIVLSGQTQQKDLVRSLALTHLFLSKPCDTEMLRQRVGNILIRGDQIRDQTLKSLIAQLGGVPSLSQLFRDVMQQFDAENPDLEKIAQTVATDIGMSSTVLHFANSGYFGPATTTSNAERAVQRLGIETVRDLIVRNRLCCSFDSSGFQHFDVFSLWTNSISTARFARELALSHSKDSVLVDDAFASGLFRDIGEIILASLLGHFYDSVVERAVSSGEPLWKIERDMIGSTHAEVGAYLLGLWGMPDAVVDAVARHHETSGSGVEEFSVLTAVHMADTACELNICKTES